MCITLTHSSCSMRNWVKKVKRGVQNNPQVCCVSCMGNDKASLSNAWKYCMNNFCAAVTDAKGEHFNIHYVIQMHYMAKHLWTDF